MNQQISKNHHFIPKCVQKGFICPDTKQYYRCVQKTDNKWVVERANISNTAYIRKLNTLRENGSFSDSLEQSFGPIDNDIGHICTLLQNNDIQNMSDSQWVALESYANTLIKRHPLRIHQQRQGILDEKTKTSILPKEIDQTHANWMATVHTQQTLPSGNINLLFNNTPTPFILTDSYLAQNDGESQCSNNLFFIPVTSKYAIQLTQKPVINKSIIETNEVMVDKLNKMAFTYRNTIAMPGNDKYLKELLSCSKNDYRVDGNNGCPFFNRNDDGIYYPLIKSDRLNGVIYSVAVSHEISFAITSNK